MSEVYDREPLFFAYAKWHYGQGLRELFGVAGNFLWFVAHFFSFKLLLKTWFSPWKRLGEKYEGGFNFEALASVIVVNTLMRIVGFITRTIVLCVGLLSYLFVLALSLLVILIWLLAPAVVLGSAALAAAFLAT